MSSKDGSSTTFVRTEFADPKLGIDVPVHFKIEHIFHGKVPNKDQLELMLCGFRPYGNDLKKMHVHHIIQRDHADGGSVALLSIKLHQSRQLHKSTFKRPSKWRHVKASGGNSTIRRGQFMSWSRGMLKAFAVNIIDGVIKCPMLDEAERNSFKDNPKSKYHAASKFAQAFKPDPRPGLLLNRAKQLPLFKLLSNKVSPSSAENKKAKPTTTNMNNGEFTPGFAQTPRFPNPGGIEISALTIPSSMPQCKDIRVQMQANRLWVTFGNTKYWFSTKELNLEEIAALDLAVNYIKVNRICIDIHCSPEYYNVFLECGLQGTSVADHLMRADFLLAALVFGRHPQTGRLFVPKAGQLKGYKNPVLEMARLLKTDSQYAAARCRYSQVWVHPTLVGDQPFSLPSVSWWMNWSPELQFPKSTLRLVCRLVLVDPFGKTAFYDVPDSLDGIHEDAEVLLRPFMPLITAFKNHGAEWIASEPVLRKVDYYARFFQILTVARSDGISMDTMEQIKKQSLNIPKTHFKKVMEPTYLVQARPGDTAEIDVLSPALKAALMTRADCATDNLIRATLYQGLGFLCSSLEDYDNAALYQILAVENYLSIDKSDSGKATTVHEGLVMCLPGILFTLSKTCPDWIVDKNGRTEPKWWEPLHRVFRDALVDIHDMISQLRSDAIATSKGKVAAPICLEMMVLHLAYDMLAGFEQQGSIHGISCICTQLTIFFRSLPKADIPVTTTSTTTTTTATRPSVERPWKSLQQMSETLASLLDEPHHADDEDDEVISYLYEEELLSNTPMDQSDPLGVKPSKKPVTEPNSKQQKEDFLQGLEGLIDVYFVRGDFAESLASALVAVEVWEALGRATIGDLERLWGKAAHAGHMAAAQWDIVVARKLIEGVAEMTSGPSILNQDNKTAMLSYLEEAHRMLVCRQDDFPRSSTLLQSCSSEAMAMVHARFADPVAASRWSSGAALYREAAKSLNDESFLLQSYCTWVLSEKDRGNKDACKCTEQWQLMTTKLVTLEKS